MAFAWNAHYGYVLGTTSQSPNLEGMHFADLTFTDTDKLFIIPESKSQPVPPNQLSYVDLATATLRRGSLTEYYYATYIPYITNNRTAAAVSSGNVEASEQNLTELFPYALKYPIRLIARLKTLCTGDVYYKTFVALKGRHRVITYNGEIYSFTDNDDTLHKIWPTTGGSGTGTFYASYEINNVNNSCAISCLGDYIPTSDNIDNLNPNYLYKYGIHATQLKTYGIWEGSTGSALTDSATFMNAIGLSTGDYDYRTDPNNPTTDPYNPPFTPVTPGPSPGPGQPSIPGGGTGTFNIPTTQPTPIPTGTDLPNPSALGLYHLYNPSAGQLAALGMELYGLPDSDLKLISRMVNSPMEAILSVHCLPYTPASSAAVAVQLGHYTATATAAVCTYDHEIIDCGNLKIDEIWGSYLDYNMSVSLYLPFVGFIPLKPDDVIGKTLNVNYIIDNATGSFCAYVIRADDGVVLGTFGGNCSYQIPLTSTNYSEIIHAVTGLAASAISGGAALATGGLAAPIAAGLASSALNVATSKKHYETAGGLGTNTGFMGVRYPYIKVMVPNACVPQNQNRYKGYPSYMTRRIGDLSGYTEVDAIHLDMLPATPAEIDEIRRRLSEGVYL